MVNDTPPHIRRRRNGGIHCGSPLPKKFCWQEGCKEVVEGRSWHCSQHQLKSYESYCGTSFCYYKVWSQSYCSHCQLTHYPETYAKHCRTCWTKILKTCESDYCVHHNNVCLTVDCNNRISKHEIYCSLHNLKSLVQQKTSLSNLQEIIRFETWWNNNLATVINNNNGYWVFLVVYEPTVKNMDEVIRVFPTNYFSESYWGDSGKLRKKHSDLTAAKNEANWLINQLTSQGKYYENPILLIHPYTNFGNIVKEPYIKSYSIGNYDYKSNIFYWEASGSDPSNWDNHIKPLDVIKVEKKHKFWAVNFDHVAVYLGNNKVCHMYDSRILDKYMKVRVDDISVFLGNTDNTARCGRVWVYHPVIPFKNYRKIACQVAWAEMNNYWEGSYDLVNRNCEHFANMIVYGVNYSEQVERKEGWFIANNVKNATFFGLLSTLWHDYSINNSKSTLKLTNELRETEDKLGSTSSDHWRAHEVEIKYLQEVPVKDNCRIM